MPESRKKYPLYTCHECDGQGGFDNNICQDCLGVGMLVYVSRPKQRKGGDFYAYWGKKMSYFRITQARHQKHIRVMINGLFFIFGMVGFLALVKLIYTNNLFGYEIYKVIFVQNEWSLVWWFSIVADMYLVYRLSKESKIFYKLPKKPRLNFKNDKQNFDLQQLKQTRAIEISNSFESGAMQIVEDAWMLAHRLGHAQVLAIHLFASMFENTQVNTIFARLGTDYTKMSQKVKNALSAVTEQGSPKVSIELKRVLLTAYYHAYSQRKERVGATDLVFALAHNENIVQEILYELSITEREIGHVVDWVDLQKWLIKKWHEFRYKAKFKPKNAMNRTYTAIATPNLDAISHDMTLYAKAGAYEPCINRLKEIDEIFRVLEMDKLGAILVGESGVGKKTVVEGIAELMVEEEVPEILVDKRLVAISVSGLIAGASRVGEMEKRIIKVMNEVAKSENIVLFIEDIHHMVGVTAEGGKSMDVAETLAEQMQLGNFFVIATTTPSAYKEYVENSSLAKTMQKVNINEPEIDGALSILEAKTLFIEGKNNIYFSYQALENAIKLSSQYIHDAYLPEKSIKIIQDSALAVREKKGEKSIVGSEDVAKVVSNITNIPVTKLTQAEAKTLLNLEEKMHQRIVGQEQAVKLVASALRRARAKLRSEDRPIASFLFLGPTGVGKTEVARTLSQVYFGSAKNMIRVDMSEYQSNDALSKLIGDAQTGTFGYLTEAVRKSPFALILLDEVEKAKLDILNVFLQVLDEGRLTDAAGKTVDFTNTIIIGTSNAGTDYIQQELRKDADLENIRQSLINYHLKDFFRPELLNRFDGIVVFKPLNMNQVKEITKIFLSDLAEQVAEKGVEFEYREGAVDKLAEIGYDPTLGARPLRRVIQDKIDDNLAKIFLQQKAKRRDKIILYSDLHLEVVKAKEI